MKRSVSTSGWQGEFIEFVEFVGFVELAEFMESRDTVEMKLGYCHVPVASALAMT